MNTNVFLMPVGGVPCCYVLLSLGVDASTKNNMAFMNLYVKANILFISFKYTLLFIKSVFQWDHNYTYIVCTKVGGSVRKD